MTEYWDIYIFGHDVTEREPFGLSGYECKGVVLQSKEAAVPLFLWL